MSTLAARAAAASSMRRLGSPSATALVIPPCASTSSISAQAFSSSSRVSASTYQLPPSGSATAVTPLSSARMSCVLRAIRAEKSVGSAIASSKLLVCSDCVPPSTAASASIVVRTTLLYGACSVRGSPPGAAAPRRRRAAPRGARLDRRADDVVVRVLLGQRDAARLAVRPQQLRLLGLRTQL